MTLQGKGLEYGTVLFRSERTYQSVFVCVLPFDTQDQKMQTPLDFGTVDKAVYVTGVHCLSMIGSRSLTYYTEKEKKI